MTFSDHTIMWHVYPLGFLGAQIRPTTQPELQHRLGELEKHLDYLIDLGANSLQLGPIFRASTHGYDTTDFFTIDPRLGDDADFDQLITACRERGISVVLDGVFNHIGREHPLAATGELLLRQHSGEPAVFEGHPDLVELNHADDRVVDLVTEVMLYWLRRGIQGWRLDATYAVAPEFWAKVLPRVRAEFPKVWIVGEMIHGDYSAYVTASGVDSITQYELWKATWSSLHDKNFFELEWCLKRHNDFLDTFVPMTFVGNHDVTRIASRVGDEGAALAAFILFSVGGVPNIYYGDEQAFRGIKEDRVGGDDAVRPEFSQPLAPEGEWLFRMYQELIACRRRHPWIVRARTRTLELSNTRYVFESYSGADKLVVTLEIGERTGASISSPNGEVLVAYSAS